MVDSGFSPLHAPLDLGTLSFLDNLLPAVAAADSRFPLAARLPGDSCYDCLRSSAATTHCAEGPACYRLESLSPTIY